MMLNKKSGSDVYIVDKRAVSVELMVVIMNTNKQSLMKRDEK